MSRWVYWVSVSLRDNWRPAKVSKGNGRSAAAEGHSRRRRWEAVFHVFGQFGQIGRMIPDVLEFLCGDLHRWSFSRHFLVAVDRREGLQIAFVRGIHRWSLSRESRRTRKTPHCRMVAVLDVVVGAVWEMVFGDLAPAIFA